MDSAIKRELYYAILDIAKLKNTVYSKGAQQYSFRDLAYLYGCKICE